MNKKKYYVCAKQYIFDSDDLIIMAKTACCGSNRSLTAQIVFYMIFKPQSNRSGLYVNNVTLGSNRSLTAAWTLRKPLWFEPQ